MAARGSKAAFDAARAGSLLLTQTALGPRLPGSPGHAAVREWLRGEPADHAES